VGEMVVMMADKTHKEEEDKKMEDIWVSYIVSPNTH
jgi:hypothetical protein